MLPAKALVALATRTSTNARQETTTGRLKGVPLVHVYKWIVGTWSMVSANVVTKCFKVTGIPNELDGTEDNPMCNSKQVPSQFCSDRDKL